MITDFMTGRIVGTKGRRKSAWGFMKPVQPDDKLSEIIGNSPLPRSELTKRLWDYIRKHGLQDKEHKIIINADEKLQVIFGGKARVTIFEMAKLVSSHWMPLGLVPARVGGR
jgi:chromatin remodeling complex protein RSC6